MSPKEPTNTLLFNSYHRGLNWWSLLRIPIGLLIFGVQYGVVMIALVRLAGDSSFVELAVFIAFLAILKSTMMFIEYFIPGIQQEQIHLLPGKVEWTTEKSGKKISRVFSCSGIQLKSSRFDYVRLITSSGEKLTLHKCWLPDFHVPTERVHYCVLTIVDGVLFMQGVIANPYQPLELTEQFLCLDE